jgi:hypothetical protein
MKPEMFWKAALQQLKDAQAQQSTQAEQTRIAGIVQKYRTGLQAYQDRANALTALQRSYGEWEPKSVVVPYVNTSWSRPLTSDDREFLHSIRVKADA